MFIPLTVRPALNRPSWLLPLARRNLRVSALARRIAAAYGDANLLLNKAKMHHSLPFLTCQDQKDAHLKMEHDGTT